MFSVRAGFLLSLLLIAFRPMTATATMLGDKPEMVGSFGGGMVGVGIYQDQVKLKDADASSGSGSGVTLSRTQAYAEVGAFEKKQIFGVLRVGAVRSEKLDFVDGSPSYKGTVPFVGFTSGGPIFSFNDGKSGVNGMADVEYTGAVDHEDSTTHVFSDNTSANVALKSTIRNLVQLRAGVVAHHTLWQSATKSKSLMVYNGIYYNAVFASVESKGTIRNYAADGTLTSSGPVSRRVTTMKAAVPVGVLVGMKFNVFSRDESEMPNRWSVALEAQYQGALGGGLTVARTF